MLNARGRTPRATMSLPPLVPFLYASHSPFFVFLFLSSTSSTDIYGIFFIAPAAFRSARSRLVSSCLEEAPGTRNVSISVTIDGVPSRVSSPDFGGRGTTYGRKPVLRVLVTEYRDIFAALAISPPTFRRMPRPRYLSQRASANFLNRVLPLTRANLEVRLTSNKCYRD